MASCLEIVDEEYIEELKDKTETENTKKNTEYWKNINVFKKGATGKKLSRKFGRVREQCPRPNTVAVLCIQKLSNFALYVIISVTWSFHVRSFAVVRPCSFVLVTNSISFPCTMTMTWLVSYRLLINDSKTEVLLVGSRQQLSKVNIEGIKVGEAIFKLTESVRNLGV